MLVINILAVLAWVAAGLVWCVIDYQEPSWWYSAVWMTCFTFAALLAYNL